MCGIYGIVSLSRRLIEPPPLGRVRAALHHRGPDGSGCRQLPHALFGAERLRIIDPRSHADQPFASPDNRLWLVCNGEIYNAPDLRLRFAGYPYRSASDVEPILPLVMHGGPDALALLDGMFALALWDEARARLLLARDRAGEKPLFYARLGDTIAFASELEALLHLTGRRRDPDWDAARDFLALGYVREPRTVFAGVHQVDPGTISTVDAQGEHVVRYWEPERIDVMPIAAGDAADRLEASLGKAVDRQLRADRPRGVFSSGGVDSGLLAALEIGRAHV